MSLAKTLCRTLNGIEAPLITVETHLANGLPAFTIVAECKYALTGVGAAMACGNQKWNGNCADLVNAPNSTSTNATSYKSCD